MNQFILALSLLIFVCGCQPSQNSNREIIESSTLQSESGLISTPDTGASSSTGSDATITLTIKTNSSVIRSESVVLSSGVQGFSLLTTSCPNINNSRTCTVRVKFTVGSKENGTYSDNLLIGDLSVPLSLVLNKPIPVNDITGLIVLENSTEISSLNFGNLSGNNSVVKTLIIKDPSKKVKETLMISSSTSDFSVFTTSCAAALINSSAGCTVRIQLSSAGKPLGSLNSNLSIGEKVFLMSANIQGVAANNPILQLLIDDTEVSAKDFGTVSLGNKSSVIIKIKNSGTSSSVGNSLVVSGQAFSVTGSSCSSVVAAGATCQLTLNLNAINLSGLQLGSLSYGGKTLALQAIINGSCPVDKHSENGLCVSNIQTENISNGTRTRNYASSTWGAWIYSCNPGYSSNGNSCLANSIACEIFELPPDAVDGEKIFNGSSYGSCLAKSCTPGHFPVSGACLDASIGYYADGSIIIPCPANTSTATSGASSSAACLAIAGFFKDTDDLVKVVGENHYSAHLDNERHLCENPSLVTSVSRGVTNASQVDCNNSIIAVNACSAGAYVKNSEDKFCTLSEIGYYADGPSTLATQCPTNLTTLAEGSNNLANCIAMAGYRLENSSAVACNNGSYQDLVGQTTCKTCTAPTDVNKANYLFTNSQATISNSCAYEITECKTTFYPSLNKQVCDSGVTVVDLNPGSASSSMGSNYMKMNNGKILLTAITANEGNELFVLDETSAQISLLKDINPGTASSSAVDFFQLPDGRFLFTAITANEGNELWITDGSPSGTFLLKDINPGTSGSQPQAFYTLANGKTIFLATTATQGREFWITDGTTAGTNILKDINPGVGSSPFFSNTLSNLIAPLGDGRYVFSAQASNTNYELHITDGTTAGTSLLKEIHSTATANVQFLINIGPNKVVFSATDGTSNGQELWTTNGTAVGTVLVKKTSTQTASSTSSINNLYPTGDGRVIYSARHASSTFDQLTISDGTANGTVLLKEINPTGSSAINYFYKIGVNKFLFVANGGSTIGTELYVTDLTAQGTFLLKDTYPGSSNGMSIPTFFSMSNGKFLFTARNASGSQPWVTDGTSEGTFLLKTIAPGNAALISPVIIPDGRVVFGAMITASSEFKMFVTDGTVLGTDVYGNFNLGIGNPGYLLPFGNDNKAIFKGLSSTLGTEPHILDLDSIDGIRGN